MCAATPRSERPVPAGTDPVDELRTTVTAVASPVVRTAYVRRSTDLVLLSRDAARVTGSVRLPAHRGGAPVEERQQQVAEALRAVVTGLVSCTSLRPQSLLVTAGARLRMLARLESAAGPLLAGGSGPRAATDLLAVVAGLDAAVEAPAEAPRGWRSRPLVLRPAVAAVLLTGVRLVLAGTAATRLEGRRVLPPVTLTDRPTEHPEGVPDDAGQPATAHTIVREGRVRVFPVAPDTGLPSGRAQWRHEERRPVAAPVHALTLTGTVTVAEPGEDTVELTACVEGLRRYHPDGRLQMLCLARSPAASGAFLVAVQARPLSLLRAVVGLTGDTVTTYTEHEIETPSLVLPSADELTRKCHALLSSL